MKQVCLYLLVFLLLASSAQAGHISGGEMFYRFIGQGSNPSTARYEISLRLFRDCNPLPNPNGSNPPELPGVVTIGIFVNGTNATFIDSISVNAVTNQTIRLQNPFSCIINAPEVCYRLSTYTTTVELPVNATGYTVSYQTCCRINGLSNGSVSQGATYSANIPGSNTLGTGFNSSPEFLVKDTVLVCRNKRFQLPFTASDPDGDSLSYTFCEAFASPGFTAAVNRRPFPPPYPSIAYTGTFSGTAPLGANVAVNRQTGIISGIAPGGGFINPNGASYYVVTVCINEWRNGQLISFHRKDFIIRISNCDFADAELPLDNRTCDGFTYTFNNLTPSNEIKTWSWDFGVPNITTDVSNQAAPTYTFPDTGTYRIQLIVNKDSVCTDTAYSTIFVYPGFFPGFSAFDGCRNVPIQFTDTTRSVYGVPNFWAWDFGTTNVNDTSRLQNPTYSYGQNGSYFVKLIVGSSKGCLDTASRVVVISDRPAIQITNDTLICSIDTLQLRAVGQGSFEWTPNYNISSLTVANPLVSPDIPTRYTVTVTLAPGCVNSASVLVNVVDSVSLTPPRDTVICRGDPVTLRPGGDGLYYSWSPPALFVNPMVRNAVARPTAASTLFTVVSSIGKCNKTATVTVQTVPYPVVNAGPDGFICTRDTIRLNGSGNASSWTWSPARFTANPSSLSTLAFPLSTTSFVLRGTDTLGCPKPSFDTAIVRVIPPVRAFAGADTAVVVGQQLQLTASGGVSYQWRPPAFLNATNIANPVAVFDASRERFSYILTAFTAEGCVGVDTIDIRIFKTAPDIFVPTAFTPNGDGLNDEFIPVAVGISRLDYFRVFNRWGNEVFATTQMKQGWNGTYKGIDQAADTYVWMVRGVDFTGRVVEKKGTMVLIR